MTEGELFELTEEQGKAFRRLKRAHADCIKLGVYFYNNYGTLGALDSSKFSEHPYDDENGDGAMLDQGFINENEMQLRCNEWADDNHYFHPAQ